MKFFPWVIAYVSFIVGMACFSLNYNLKKEVVLRDQFIEHLENKVEDLEEKQKNLDWLENEIPAIDKYISVIDQLKLNANGKFPELERTAKEMNEARIEVVLNAIYWDRELNKREEVK